MDFAAMFSGLRRESGLSQRKVAGDLGISQALLSHYENGVREPRLEFVEKACAYYGVTADYMLGLDPVRENPLAALEPREGEAPLLDWSQGGLKQVLSAVGLAFDTARRCGGEETAELAARYARASLARLLLELRDGLGMGENAALLLDAEFARTEAVRRLHAVLRQRDGTCTDEEIEELTAACVRGLLAGTAAGEGGADV